MEKDKQTDGQISQICWHSKIDKLTSVYLFLSAAPPWMHRIWVSVDWRRGCSTETLPPSPRPHPPQHLSADHTLFPKSGYPYRKCKDRITLIVFVLWYVFIGSLQRQEAVTCMSPFVGSLGRNFLKFSWNHWQIRTVPRFCFKQKQKWRLSSHLSLCHTWRTKMGWVQFKA